MKEATFVLLGQAVLVALFLVGMLFLILAVSCVGSVESFFFFGISALFLVFSFAVVICGFKNVPEEEFWIIEVLGKYHRTVPGGLRWLCPVVEKARAAV